MTGRNLLPSGDVTEQNVSYYDLALAVVPLPLLVGFVAGTVLSVPLRTGIAAGAVLSAMVVGHLLFRDPPTRRGPRGSVGSKSVGESSA